MDDQIPPELLQGPAALPPPGVVPNLVNPESQGQLLIVLPAVLVSVMWVSVTIRLLMAFCVVKVKSADDVACFVSAVLTTLYFGITVAGVQHQHIGTHLWDVKLGDLTGVDAVKADYLALIMSPLTMLFIKSTFFLMYLKIFRPMRVLLVACYFGLAVTVLAYLGWFIAFVVLATPRPGETWQAHFQIKGGVTDQASGLSIPLPAFGLALDIFILIVPIYGISGLQLSRKRKIGVLIIFMTAIVAILCSILSVIYRVKLQRHGNGDLTWDLAPVLLTSALEMNLGVIVLCMPAFSLLVRTSKTFYGSIRSRLSSRASKSQSRFHDEIGGKDYRSLGPQDEKSSKNGIGYVSYIESGSASDMMHEDREMGSKIRMTTVISQERLRS